MRLVTKNPATRKAEEAEVNPALNARIEPPKRRRRLNPSLSNLLHKTFSKGAQKLLWFCTESCLDIADICPYRCACQKSAILALLRERGPRGILGSELYDAREKFGRSPRSKISELRREDCLIPGEPRGASDWRYILLRDSSGEKPLPSGDWYERQFSPRPNAHLSKTAFSERRLADPDCSNLMPSEPRR